MKQFKLTNSLAVPKIMKVVVNVGLGEAVADKGVVQKASEVLTMITGQKPKVTSSRQAIAGFKLRKGVPIGLQVTLRKKRMTDFLEKLFRIVLPRLRDFQGVSLKSFDGRGNYSLGLNEQIIFPEVDYDKVDKVRGMEITIVTNSNSDKMSQAMLAELGMPFEKGKTQGEKYKKGK